MKLLSLECSATPCSVAITENEKILASAFINVKITHSQTLMPLVENMLAAAKISFDEISGIAVGIGPGSFTGIRIGISAVKGLAAAKKLPCVGVSTLEAIAYNFIDRELIVCAVMDARCNQVYNGIFKINNGNLTRLCEDRAIACQDLKKELEKLCKEEKECVIIAGDGTEVFYSFIEDNPKIIKSHIKHRFQNAESVSLAAQSLFLKGEILSPNELEPVYLRLPQAERELKLKKELTK